MVQNHHVTRREFLRQSTAAAAGLAGACACGGLCGRVEAAVAHGKFQYDGYCGDYCGACPQMLVSESATKHADIKCCGCKLTRPNGKKSGVAPSG